MRVGYLGSREPRVELVDELLFNNRPGLIAVDVETVSLDNLDIVGIGIAPTPEDSFFFPAGTVFEPSPYLNKVIDLLKDRSVLKIFHNALFDLKALQPLGIDSSNIADTLIMSYLANSDANSIQHIAGALGIEYPLFPRIKSWIFELSEKQIVHKCCLDAKVTMAAFNHFSKLIDMNYFWTEMKLIPLLVKMSSRGLAIDQKLRAELEKKLEAEVAELKAYADELGFNPASPKQVAYVISEAGYYLPWTRSKRSLSTDEAVLKQIDHPIAALVLNYRKATKLLSTYILPLKGADRCYTKFSLDSITGRISSAEHNMQNIPRGEMRNIFVPDSGWWTDLDFNQIELRTLAYITGDSRMLATYQAETDLHQATADFMGISRQLAKNVNFAVVYGATAQTIAEIAEVSPRKGAELRDNWMFQFPEAAAWIEEQQRRGLRDMSVRTLFGRNISLPLGKSEDAIKRRAVNYVIQGSAAEIVKRAMIRCAEAGLDEKMVLQVHDELLFDGNVTAELMELCLDKIAPFDTPFGMKLLKRWE